MKSRVPLVMLLALVLLARPVSAAILVFDPSNFTQNVLTAVRSLEQIKNQVLQLENEALMLVNDAKNLANLPFNIVGELRDALNATTTLIREAQGVTFDLGQARSNFVRFYPGGYTSSASSAFMANDVLWRSWHAWQSLYTTVSMQAEAARNLQRDEQSLTTLVGQSQGAIGALQAAQATNQLLALHSRQLIQEQQLRLTQDRTVALEQSRSLAEQARALEIRRRFMGTGTSYTPVAVGGFGS